MDDRAGYPSKETLATLDAVLDEFAEHQAYRPTLNGLLEGWRRFVADVETGYDWSVYEYFNDLAVRRQLQTIADRVSELTWLTDELKPLDDRFLAATRERPPGGLTDRVPLHPGEELARDLDDPDATTTLYRPVGDNELALIAETGFRRFPPRLPEQPIFYPVLTAHYAERIANEWNARDGKRGHVTRFAVRTSFVRRYPAHAVGGEGLRELWVPAAELEAFCDHIVGPIDVITVFES